MAYEEFLANVLLKGGEDFTFCSWINRLFSSQPGKKRSHFDDREIADLDGTVFLVGSRWKNRRTFGGGSSAGADSGWMTGTTLTFGLCALR